MIPKKMPDPAMRGGGPGYDQEVTLDHIRFVAAYQAEAELLSRQSNRRFLLRYMARQGGSVTFREVRRSLRRYRSGDAASRDIEALIELGLLAWDHHSTRKAGRPAKRIRLVQNNEKAQKRPSRTPIHNFVTNSATPGRLLSA